MTSTTPAWYRPSTPYEPGNTAHLVHGGDSERMIEARAVEVRSMLLVVAPWLDVPEYAPAVARFLRAESRSLMLHEHIVKVTDTAGAGKVSSRLWEQATAADRLAAQLGNVLGLDPLGRARLQQATAGAELEAISLAQLAEQGRQTRAGQATTIPASRPDSAPLPLNRSDATQTTPKTAEGR